MFSFYYLKYGTEKVGRCSDIELVLYSTNQSLSLLLFFLSSFPCLMLVFSFCLPHMHYQSKKFHRTFSHLVFVTIRYVKCFPHTPSHPPHQQRREGILLSPGIITLHCICCCSKMNNRGSSISSDCLVFFIVIRILSYLPLKMHIPKSS